VRQFWQRPQPLSHAIYNLSIFNRLDGGNPSPEMALKESLWQVDCEQEIAARLHSGYRSAFINRVHRMGFVPSAFLLSKVKSTIYNSLKRTDCRPTEFQSVTVLAI
jgi:hypothetical protein